MADPNPASSGKGFEKLRAPACKLKPACWKQKRASSTRRSRATSRRGKPLVTLKSGMTLDGKIAPPPEESPNPASAGAGGATGGWITSAEARAHVQELRHESDAIMVGVGTIIAEIPCSPTAPDARRRPLLRVVLDSRLRTSTGIAAGKNYQRRCAGFMLLCGRKKRRELEKQGIRVEQVPLGSSNGRPDLSESRCAWVNWRLPAC